MRKTDKGQGVCPNSVLLVSPKSYICNAESVFWHKFVAVPTQQPDLSYHTTTNWRWCFLYRKALSTLFRIHGLTDVYNWHCDWQVRESMLLPHREHFCSLFFKKPLFFHTYITVQWNSFLHISQLVWKLRGQSARSAMIRWSWSREG